MDLSVIQPIRPVKHLIRESTVSNLTTSGTAENQRRIALLNAIAKTVKKGTSVIETEAAKKEVAALMEKEGTRGAEAIQKTMTLETAYFRWEKRFVKDNPDDNRYFSREMLNDERIGLVKNVLLKWWDEKWWLSDKVHKLAYQTFEEAIILPTGRFKKVMEELLGIETFNVLTSGAGNRRTAEDATERIRALRAHEWNERKSRHEFKMVMARLITKEYLDAFETYRKQPDVRTLETYMRQVREVVLTALRAKMRHGAIRFLEFGCEEAMNNACLPSTTKAGTLRISNTYERQAQINQAVWTYQEIANEFDLSVEDKSKHVRVSHTGYW